MMWVVASIPLWVLGGLCMFLAAIGVLAFCRDCDGKENETAAGVAVALVGAAIFLTLAAKVAS